jgi:hypothetical protein
MNVFVDETHQSAHHDFVRWIDRNYDTGYVLNPHSSRGPMIHRAHCGHFKHGNLSHSLTSKRKICFQSSQEYGDWSRKNREYAQSVKSCPDCM